MSSNISEYRTGHFKRLAFAQKKRKKPKKKLILGESKEKVNKGVPASTGGKQFNRLVERESQKSRDVEKEGPTLKRATSKYLYREFNEYVLS